MEAKLGSVVLRIRDQADRSGLSRSERSTRCRYRLVHAAARQSGLNPRPGVAVFGQPFETRGCGTPAAEEVVVSISSGQEDGREKRTVRRLEVGHRYIDLPTTE